MLSVREGGREGGRQRDGERRALRRGGGGVVRDHPEYSRCASTVWGAVVHQEGGEQLAPLPSSCMGMRLRW